MTASGSSQLILLIEMDDETRPLLQYNLRNQGYKVITAINEEGALERVKDGRAYPNLILINQVSLSIEAYLAMGQRIRDQAGLSRQTPIVVVADRYGTDLEGQDIEVRDREFISYPEDAQQLFDLLHRLCREAS
ncbi:MAG: hypothetical protein F6J97_03765 [Leptolyngbya sp. SIO4C1]|nr:hypothetical protein [Leptolyngbya sp. SIO4C1]